MVAVSLLSAYDCRKIGASRRLWWCLLSYVLAVTFFLLTVVLLFKWGGAPN